MPPSLSKWSVIGTKGYKYKDKPGSEDGIQKVIVKGSTSNKSKALVKGKGDAPARLHAARRAG